MSDMKKEDWMNSKWRPMMGWMYMLVCTMDFVVFPILWSIIQTIGGGHVETQWDPITLRGAGLFHMAMGAIVGVTAWSRGQEKMVGANNGGLQQSAGFGVSSTTPSNVQAPTSPSGFSQPGPAGSSDTSGFGSVSTAASSKSKVPVGNEPEL